MKRAAIANLAAPVPSAVTSSEPKEDNTKGKKQAKLSNFFAASKPKKEEAEAVSESAPASSEKKVVELKSVSYDFENIKKQFDGEGRTITLEFDKFYLVACYVPNSGSCLLTSFVLIVD